MQRNARASARILLIPNDYSGVRGGQAVMYVATLSDEELLQEALRGDGQAAAVLVGRYNERAVRVAFRRLGDVEMARDVVQNHWIELLQSARREFPRRFETFFWTLFKRRVIDAWRKQKRSREYLDLDAPLSSEDDSATKGSQMAADLADPLDKMIVEEEKGIFWKAMDLLPPRYRAAIEVRGLQGLPWREAAEVLIARELMTGEGNIEKQMQNHFYRAQEALSKLITDLSSGGDGRDV
jgi:RNA polymerase sigma-70 factor, ECF subfamily